jgi:hypothetical protein
LALMRAPTYDRPPDMVATNTMDKLSDHDKRLRME